MFTFLVSFQDMKIITLHRFITNIFKHQFLSSWLLHISFGDFLDIFSLIRKTSHQSPKGHEFMTRSVDHAAFLQPVRWCYSISGEMRDGTWPALSLGIPLAYCCNWLKLSQLEDKTYVQNSWSHFVSYRCADLSQTSLIEPDRTQQNVLPERTLNKMYCVWSTKCLKNHEEPCHLRL